MPASEFACAQIETLVKRFKSLSAAERKGMNENATRQGYILPMFRALGWNVDNVNEVSPEEKVSRGFVDFSFRIGGIPRYFLETKKASEDLNDPRWVQQAIDYAWTKSVTWALLSDFEGLRVFNAEWKETDPFRAQFVDFNLDTYLTDFERLWWFSREETAAGRLEREADKVGKRVKRLPVSLNLFDDLRSWRSELYKSLRGYNPKYSPAQIDEAVLRLLNRLIFIRTAEDRDVEPMRLMPLLRELEDQRQLDKLSAKLNELFRQFDATYNSELFAPHFSEELYCDRPPLEALIRGLYEKNFVRYNFNALEADVLGTAYEQYLGHIVTETQGETGLIAAASHVEEKRAKRKSQGIYYTPAFVTKYIVQQTVSRYLDERGYNPSAPPRILDMACGSGSFLIEAFDTLDRFVAKQRNQAHGSDDDLHDNLRRLELLQTCIFGVDKDKQAVDVARLNLLLRALHGRQKLPLLTNIYNADSLRPETWPTAFPEIMKEGGFDIIIGNPPYVRIQTLDKTEVEYFNQNFVTATGNYDIYVLFVEQALRLLKPGGVMGFILPNKFMQSDYGIGLRKVLSEKKVVSQIVDFGDSQVFEGASTYTCILILQKSFLQSFEYSFVKEPNTIITTRPALQKMNSTQLGISPWVINGGSTRNLLERLLQQNPTLGGLTEKIFVGLQTSADTVFLFKNHVKVSKNRIRVHSKALERSIEIETGLLKPVVRSGEIGRYFAESTALILFPYRLESGNAILLSEEELAGKYPLTWAYLQENQELLENREHGKFKNSGWYQLYPKNLHLWEQPKLMLPYMVTRLASYPDESGNYYFVNVTTGGFGITLHAKSISLNYLAAILNSRLLDYLFKSQATKFHGGYFGANKQYIENLPIRRIDFANPAEKSAHDEIVKRVEEMLALQKQRQQAEAGKEDVRFSLQKRIEALDKEIDVRVYRLYGLTEEEVKIVEGS